MSRLSRLGLVAGGAGASLAAVVLVLTPAPPAAAQSSPDATHASRILAAARGADPVVCKLALQALNGNWGWRGRHYAMVPDSRSELSDLMNWALQRRSDPSVVPALRSGLRDTDACVRRIATRLLGRTHHASATDALTSALRDPDPTTREMAAIGLGYAEDHTAVPDLLRMVDDDVADVRAAIAWALGQIEDHRAVAPLTRMLQQDPEPRVRRVAATALGMMY